LNSSVAITGAVLSCTLIVCGCTDELPESVAVQVLVIEYEPAHEPLVVTSAVNVKAEPQASSPSLQQILE
jgi:hypothetical protein